MPMKGRRPSATKTTHTAVPQVDAEEANIQDFAPPEWRTVLNSRADLGEWINNMISLSIDNQAFQTFIHLDRDSVRRRTF